MTASEPAYREPVVARATARLGWPILALVLLFSVSLVLAACSETGADTPSPPLPTLSHSPGSMGPTSEKLRAGLGDAYTLAFRSEAGDQIVTAQVLEAVWRESTTARDGEKHEHVLALAVQIANSGPTPLGKLRTMGELELSDGTKRRSGRFSVPQELGTRDQTAGTARGWMVFEDVDWEALQGKASPPASRFRLHILLYDGMGIGEWYVSASSNATGSRRTVRVLPLSATVSYLLQ